MNFEVSIEGIEELQREWRSTFVPRLGFGITQAVRSAMDAGVAVAKARVPVSNDPKGTHLREVIAGRIVSATGGGGGWTVTAEIIAPKRYAIFLEGGTAAHVIRPKSGAFGPMNEGQSRKRGAKPHLLVFKGADGKWISKQEVHHPGTKPHPFMGVAYFAAEQRLEAELAKAVQAAADAFNGAR